MKKEIIYVGDPMCSWCWGFSPVIETIRSLYGGMAVVSLVTGGLRPGGAETMDGGLGDMLRRHWEQVRLTTGQPFTLEMLSRKDFVYNTEPACRAVVTVRELEPGSVFQYFRSLHHAFYVDNLDITIPEILSGLAEPFGIGETVFMESFDSGEIFEKTIGDFDLARRMGVTGFPSVLLKDGSGVEFLTRGFQKFESLRPALERWLETA